MGGSSLFVQKVMDYVLVLRRHLLLFAVVALLSMASTAVYITHLPDIYRAETRILVNPQRVSDKYVSSTVSMGSNERLNTLSQQVLSSSRLAAIMEDLHLFPKLRGSLGREQLLEIMRHHIAIELKQSSDGPSSFTLAYTGDSAKEVAAVANRLATSFIVWNLHDREQEAEGTTEFLSKELGDTKSRLDALEEELRTYKLQHLGELPDQIQANLQTLSRLQVQLQANVEAQSRLDHEAYLVKVDPRTASGVPSPVTQRDELVRRATIAHQELAEMRGRYRAQHPDLSAKQQEADSLDAQVLAAPVAQVVHDETPSPAVPGQDPRLHLIDRDRERLSKEQQHIVESINTYQARVNAEPIREQEITQLLRDYDTAKDHYRSLLEKTYSARMATELERRQQGGSFTMLDEARVPDAPTGPNRIPLFAGSLIFSLALGLGGVALREVLDSSVKSELELHELLAGVPVLGLTPRLISANDPFRLSSVWGWIVSSL